MKAVELTEQEKALLQRIHFEPTLITHDPDAARANAEAAGALTRSLAERRAIPEVRVQWLTDRDCNIGGRGSSRQDIFLKNGVRKEDIPRHPHFLKHLRYFLNGPDLPAAVVESFEKKVADCGMITSGDIIPLGDHAKHLTRAPGLDADRAGEEFFKLALECGIGVSDARSIRDAVRKIR